jgi:hypothetical protein
VTVLEERWTPGGTATLSRELRVRRNSLVYLHGVVTALVCMAVCVAAVLMPAPAGVLPLIAIVCIGCPMLAGWELARVAAVSPSRRARREARALADLRRGLARLPEIEHPLGL